MGCFARRAFAVAIAFGITAPAVALAADRTPDEIVKEIEAIKPPTTYAEFQEGNAKRAELIGELARSHPDDARLARLLPVRWMAMTQSGRAQEAKKEADETLAKTKDEGLRRETLYTKAQIALREPHPFNSEKPLPAIEEFARAAPKDPRVGMLLYQASMGLRDKAKKEAIEERILKDFPAGYPASAIKGLRKQRAAIGKPFELEFTDAIQGQTVSMKGLKGKVVVLDFWATWCGPCVAEMPTMKKLYAEYKGKGVEFIGVSLDQPKEAGGLDKLKKFVAEKGIDWPQYYQGDGWNSEFSKGWGINAIPCVFVIDADGKLFSTEARGKLEMLIPELLEKRDKTAAGGGL